MLLLLDMKNAFGITKKDASPRICFTGCSAFERSNCVPRFHPNCVLLHATRCAVTGAPGRGSPLHSAVVEVRHMAGCLQRVLPDGSPLCGMENGTSVCPHHRFGRFDFDAPASENLTILARLGEIWYRIDAASGGKALTTNTGGCPLPVPECRVRRFSCRFVLPRTLKGGKGG